MLAFLRLRHIKTKSLNWVKWSILSTLTSRGSTQCTQCIQHNLVWSFGQSGNSWTTQLGTARHRVLPHGTRHSSTRAHGFYGTARHGTAAPVRHTPVAPRTPGGEHALLGKPFVNNLMWTWSDFQQPGMKRIKRNTFILRDQFVLLHFWDRVFWWKL